MGALSATLALNTELSGRKKIQVFTITPGSASDTVDLSGYFTAITCVIPLLTAGTSANLATIAATVSGTTVTVVTYNAAGSNATNWGSAAATLIVIGEYN